MLNHGPMAFIDTGGTAFAATDAQHGDPNTAHTHGDTGDPAIICGGAP